MANQCNLVILAVYDLSNGVLQNHPNTAAFWRKVVPQPFNVSGVASTTPLLGQIWPRGTEQG